MMIKRLPKFAERTVAQLCSKEGALCHEVEEDESGWDRFIEFPAEHTPVPADSHPPPTSAFVQVKSAESLRLTCRVKLSNAFRAAQHRQPWFIVLIIADPKSEPVRIFAIHVWEELIRRTLKAVRIAESKKKALNRCWFTIRFGADDERGDGLISWMRQTIEAIASDYEQKKKAIYETIGYEDGHGMGHVTFTAPIDEFVDNLLGLGKGLPVTRFTYTPKRFGIPATEPQIDVAGTVQIEPHPIRTCEIRLRGAGASEAIALSGQVYSPGIPSLPRENQRLRFVAEFIDIVWSRGGTCSVQGHWDGDEKKVLASIQNYATLMEWQAAGPVDVQIWSDGKRMVGGTLSLNPPKDDVDWILVGKIVHVLRSVAGSSEGEIKLSLADVERAANVLVPFHEVVDAPSIRIEFEPTSETPPTFTSILYYFAADVSEWTFYALVERPVREDVIVDGRRQVTSGPPHRLDTYVLKDATEEADREIMHKDYDRHLAHLENVGTPLGISDMHAFLKGTQATDKSTPEE